VSTREECSISPMVRKDLFGWEERGRVINSIEKRERGE